MLKFISRFLRHSQQPTSFHRSLPIDNMPRSIRQKLGRKKKWKPKDSGSYGRGGYEEIKRANAAFESYYKAQGIVPEGEWDQFMDTLRTNLPATFRITGFRRNAKQLLTFLKSHYFNEIVDVKVDGLNVEKPYPLPWYPDELAWQLNLSRGNIRKIATLERLHGFLVTETESGNISRQESVSMIPPLLLDVQPHHKIFDMCAAPGSKTAQLIEMLHADENQTWPDGFVLANDSDNKRCYIMVHQTKRLNSPCSMIVNHDATAMPVMKIPDAQHTGQFKQLKFDRVLCDVPCSADGTLRKNYLVWKRWSVHNGFSLHPIQLRLLTRGVEVLEVGGRIVYSTCSFNPVENEAVVAALLSRSQGAVELVDCSQKLPQLKRINGLTSWKILNENGKEFLSYEDVPDRNKKRLRETMFAPKDIDSLHLDRCMRLLPHHQDSGGFFIAVLQKVTSLPWINESKNKAHSEKQASSSVDMSDDSTAKQASSVDVSDDSTAKQASSVDMSDDSTAKQASSVDVSDDSTAKRASSVDMSDDNKEGFGPPKKRPRFDGFKEDPFVFFKEDEEVWSSIREFYKVPSTFPHTQLLTRCETGRKNNLYLVNKVIKNIITNNDDKVKVINSGIRVLARSDSSEVACPFRLGQEGSAVMKPFLANRLVKLTKKDVVILLTEENPFIHKLSSEAVEQINSHGQGSLMFVYEPGESVPDESPIVVVGWRGRQSVRSFVSKGDRHHILRMCGVDITSKSQQIRPRLKTEPAKMLAVKEGNGDAGKDGNDDADNDENCDADELMDDGNGNADKDGNSDADKDGNADADKDGNDDADELMNKDNKDDEDVIADEDISVKDDKIIIEKEDGGEKGILEKEEEGAACVGQSSEVEDTDATNKKEDNDQMEKDGNK